MRVISLTYKYNEIKLSFKLSLFFRMMGVYVVEKFYKPKVNMQEDVDLLRSDFTDVRSSVPFSDFDAEIYLFNNDDPEQIRRANPLRRIVVVDQKDCSSMVEDMHCVKFDSSLPNYFSQLLYDILHAMYKLKLLDEQEFTDCRIWAKIYGENNFSQTLCQIGCDKLDEEKLILWKKQYNDIVDKMFGLEEVFSKDRNFWKQNQHKYTAFALLEIQYNINTCGHQQKQKKMFDSRELLRNALAMEENDYDLKSAVKRLIGDIYYYLLDETNTAYDYYMNSCMDNQDYNYKIFFAKGRYQQHIAGNYDSAKRYYYKSLLINPNYCRAWYNLGYCSYQQGETRNAISAFYAVRKLLEPRVESHNITPFEIRLYFSACKICAQLLYNKFANLDKAIEFFREAEKVWSYAGESTFWEFLGEESDDSVSYLQGNLDIFSVYNWLLKIYNLEGATKEVDQYKEKKEAIIQKYLTKEKRA